MPPQRPPSPSDHSQPHSSNGILRSPNNQHSSAAARSQGKTHKRSVSRTIVDSFRSIGESRANIFRTNSNASSHERDEHTTSSTRHHSTTQSQSFRLHQRSALTSGRKTISKRPNQRVQFEDHTTHLRSVDMAESKQPPSSIYDPSSDTLVGNVEQDCDSHTSSDNHGSTIGSLPRPLSFVPELFNGNTYSDSESQHAPQNSTVRLYSNLQTDSYSVACDNNSFAFLAGNEHRSSLRLVGKWKCCKCKREQQLFELNHGQHLVSTLSCECTHRSCDNCTLTGGDIKPYKPVEEPVLVHMPNDDKTKAVRFGVFCGKCGLSWRAQVIKHSVLHKISAVPKQFAKRGALPPSLGKIRRSRSMVEVFGEPGRLHHSHSNSIASVRALSNEMEKTHGEQVPTVLVKFTGIPCTCGHTLDSSALCFQITDTVQSRQLKRTGQVLNNTPSFTATSEDRARGIGRSTLTLEKNGKTIGHPNPLLGNPVTCEELERLGLRASTGFSCGQRFL